MIRRAAAGLLALGLGGSLQAQIPSKGQPINAWLESGNMAVLPPDLFHRDGAAVVHQKGGQRAVPVPPKCEESPRLVASSMGPLQAPEGKLLALRNLRFQKREGDKKPPVRLEVVRFDPQSWSWDSSLHGFLDPKPQATFYALSEDRLLGICVNNPFLDESKKPHLFALYKRNDQGRYSLAGYPDDGFDGKLFKSDGSWSYPFLANLWICRRVVWTREHTIIGAGCGLFWVFNSKGHLRRLVRLYEGLDDKALQRNQLWHEAVTNFEPREDGSILISHLGEMALNLGALLNEDRPHRSSEATAGKDFEDVFNKALGAYPLIHWTTLDPVNGKLFPEAPPLNFPAKIRTWAEFLAFNWHFKPDGNLTLIGQDDMQALSPEGKSYYDRHLGKGVP